MDTESAYIALAGESIDDLVVDRENYFRHRSEWLPAECCDEHHKDYVNARISGHPWTNNRTVLPRASDVRQTHAGVIQSRMAR